MSSATDDSVMDDQCMEPGKRICTCCRGTTTAAYAAALIRCLACGHVWADVCLSQEELARIYSDAYFRGEEYVDYALEASALRRNFRPRVLELAQCYRQGARLWEIGCAYGYFLKEAETHFNAAGCDISADAVRYACEILGVQAMCMDYLSQPPGEPLDVVCLWDVVEHLQDPRSYITKAAAELRSGGMLALSTGDIGSRHAQRRGARWRLIHPPSHLHYFTTQSMQTLLTSVGFVDIRIRHLPFWRGVNGVAYRLLSADTPGIGAAAYSTLMKSHLLHWSFPLNLHDIMTVYAVKR